MHTSLHEQISVSRHSVSRRRFLHTISASAIAAGALGFTDFVSLRADDLRKQGKSMILLWMQGGPTQFETFDPKPGHANGGETKAISTSVPGIQIAENWNNVAKSMGDITLIRSMTNKEGNHQRASYQLHTGYVPAGSVKHPSFGANIAQQISDPTRDLPTIVSIGRPEAGGGFLGIDYEPFVVDKPGEVPTNVGTPVGNDRLARRLEHLKKLEGEFAGKGGQIVVDNHARIYDKASRLVQSPLTKSFGFEDESPETRSAYGDSQFGRGCLLARRLIEQGVSFVEVRAGNWDTHFDMKDRVKALAEPVDQGMAALIADLKARGRFKDTIIVWMGEFGRTPKINPRGGRDHYPRCFNVALAGGGVKGGQVIGSSGADGAMPVESPVTVNDLYTSICQSLNVDPKHENVSPIGRPLKIVDGGTVIPGLFA